MDCLKGCPANKDPTVTKSVLPKITTRVKIITGTAYFTKRTGFINIPTETKNTAPKRSFTDFTSDSIFSAWVVSANIEPIIKAPKGAEKPTCVANTTIRKQSPTDTIIIVSSFNNFFPAFNIPGNKKMPERNHKHKKKTSFR